MLPIITSLQNPKIKNLVKLRQRRQRNRQEFMLIDGERALILALQNGFAVDTIYFDQLTPIPRTLHNANVKLQPVSGEVFAKIAYGDAPDPLVGLAPQPEFLLENLPCPPNPLYLIAEGLEKPGNVGAILRSADAAGVTGLILCHNQTDVGNPNVIRASRGALFTVPVAESTTAAAIDWLTRHNVQIFAATPDADQLYTGVDLGGAAAIAVGAEHSGLSELWLAETPIKIPMLGQVDSLNVAQSASILLFEAIRQRQAG